MNEMQAKDYRTSHGDENPKIDEVFGLRRGPPLASTEVFVGIRTEESITLALNPCDAIATENSASSGPAFSNDLIGES